jgi:protein-L-isoaspartate(D-aspartate) O-methyltransferase
MSEALAVRPEHKVLEVGTGSGYHAAVLAKLSGAVFSIERWAELHETAKARLEALKIFHVRLKCADGCEGWAEWAPFDRILITAAVDAPPPALVEQLVEGGVLVAPVGEGADGRLVRFVKTAGQLTPHDAGPAHVPPLARGVTPVS